MKLQAKSLFSSFSQTADPKTQAAEAASANRRPVELKTVANLQALASELRLFATEGTFAYPRNWVQIAGMSAIVLVGLSFARLLMLILPVIQTILAGLPLSQAGISLLQIASAAVGILLAFGMASVLLDLF